MATYSPTMHLRALAWIPLLTGCGLAVVRGPESTVLAQAKEIHVVAGHACKTEGNVVRCDADDPKRNPLLISSGPSSLGFATYADTQPTFGRSCAELAPAMKALPQPAGTKIDCADTKDGSDRLLIVGFLPIPEGGMSDADFESGVTAFMQDANAYLAALGAHSPRR